MRGSYALGLLLLIVTVGGCKCRTTPDAPLLEPKNEAEVNEVEEAKGAKAFEEALRPTRELRADPGDLPHIRQRGTLRILVEANEEDFLPRAGSPNAHERDLLIKFASTLGLKPEFTLIDSFSELVPMIEAGKGDLIAADMTITPERGERVAFTWPLASVEEVLVGKKGAQKPPRSLADLEGLSVHVRRGSSYAATLSAADAGVELVWADDRTDVEQLVYEVGQGKRPYTVADSHMLTAIHGYDDATEALFPIAEGRQIAWAVSKKAPELLDALNTFLLQHALTGHTRERFTGDLEGIRKRGVLRVITRNNPVTYFLHRGAPHGFEYELMKLAAEELGVRLEMVVPPRRDQLIPWLLEGRGDVIASSLSITEQRRKEVAFSRPYLFVDEVLVQRAEEGLSAKEATIRAFANRAIHVRRSSSYWNTLEALRGGLPSLELELVEAPEDQETELLLERVAKGEIPLTVADSHILGVELAYGQNLAKAATLTSADAKDARLRQREIAFATRPTAKALRAFLDGFVKKQYRGLHYNMFRRRYFENGRKITAAKDGRAGSTGELSPYDALIKKYAKQYGLDWRLMAAQAFQESRFDPAAKSWVGAQGLFQVMPATGKSLGFTRLTDPEEGIHAGIQYMSHLLRNLDTRIPFTQRVRFALAGYNVGIGHVADARRLAAEQGLDPDRWFGNVEKAMLLLQKPEYARRARHGYCRGSEPVKYVSEIQTRYEQYIRIVD